MALQEARDEASLRVIDMVPAEADVLDTRGRTTGGKGQARGGRGQPQPPRGPVGLGLWSEARGGPEIVVRAMRTPPRTAHDGDP